MIKQLSPILCFCLALALLTTPALLSSPMTPASPTAEVIAITGGTLIDGSGRAPVNDAVVTIKGDSIVAVGGRSKFLKERE